MENQKEQLNLIPIKEIFLPKNIQKSVNKAIVILDEIKGETIDEKLVNIGKKFKDLKIKDIKDEENYKIVHSALLDMQKVRVAIQKIGKRWRDNLTAQNRKELAYEKELLTFFLEIETNLKEEKNKIDEKKKQIERKKLLPMRKELLKGIEQNINDNTLLSMNEDEFSNFYDDLKIKFDEQKEKEKEAIEIEKQRQKEIKEVEEKAEKEKDEALKRQKIEMEKEAEAEKQRLIDEQKQKEKEAEAEKNRIRLKELEDEKVREKNKKFIDWKKENNYNQETDLIKQNGNEFILYRKISNIIIK